MRQGHEELTITTPDELVYMLNDHAEKVLAENKSNSQYAQVVRLRAQEVEDLIDSKSGEITGVISTWEKSAQPIIEAVFGMSLKGHQVGELSDYSPTRFSDIYGRVRIVSADEIWGPALSLDLIARETLEAV